MCNYNDLVTKSMCGRRPFRAMVEKTHEWTYGYYVHQQISIYQNFHIITNGNLKEYSSYAEDKVIQETISEFIGIRDVNGKMIFTFDKIFTNRGFGVVYYDLGKCAYYAAMESGFHISMDNLNSISNIEVIGTIFDEKYPPIIKDVVDKEKFDKVWNQLATMIQDSCTKLLNNNGG